VAHSAETHAGFNAVLLGKVALAGMAFGLGGQLFSELTHRLQRIFAKLVPYAPLRPAVGAVIVIAFVFALGTRDYLGLGVHAPPGGQVSIVASFQEGGATPLSWLWKTLFTSITLASGFKGGEVTPLFFIGSTMGNVLGGVLQEPVALFAALGFIAIFAGAANTPLACTVMGIELFGAHYAIYFAVACFVSYFFSGHSGIYLAQRLGVPKKNGHAILPDTTLREVRGMATMLPPASTLRAIEPLDISEDEGAFSDLTSADTMKHQITSQEMGKIRIYVTPSEKMEAKGLWGKLNAKPLYRTIINAAKKDGLMNASAFMTHYGFSGGGKVQAAGAEMQNPNLALCVEIIDRKDRLEDFCRRHGRLLQGKVIIYKHVEHWDVAPGKLAEADASPNEPIDALNTTESPPP